ncbi:PAS domain S-box-containing protein [Rhizobium sp. 9140]|nr:PAS domain S-box-containing protein [Rhizobium sp. 9140]
MLEILAFGRMSEPNIAATGLSLWRGSGKIGRIKVDKVRMNAEELAAQRIAAIRRSGLLDKAGNEQFGHLTEHVRAALDVPVAIISIVDEHRQVFAGHCGLPEPWAARGETPITHSFCQHVVATNDVLTIEDARLNDLVRDNMAIDDLGVVAYLGVPIRLPDGQLIGALAAIDTQPHLWTARDRLTLETLAKVVEKQIEVGVSELMYRSLFRDMQEGYYVASAVRDATGDIVDIRFEDINPAFQRLTGMIPDTVLGATLSQIAPDVLDDMMPAYRSVFDLGEPIVHLNQANEIGGKWFENRIRRIGADRIASVFSDVTARKLAEERLQKSEAHWRGLFEQLEEGFILGELIRDADGHVIDWRYIEVNRAWGELVGIAPSSAVGRTVHEVFHGSEDAWIPAFAAVVSSDEPLIFVREVGTTGRWYEGHAQPLDAERFVVLFVEVTARLKLEAELREQQRQLSTIIDTMPVGVLLAEAPTGRIILQNERSQQLLGRDATAAQSVDEYDIFVATHHDGSPFDPQHYPLARIMARECDSATVEVLYHRPDGSKTWISIVGEAIKDLSGDLSGAVVAVTDISDRKMVEAEKELINREMAHRLKNMLAMVQAIATQTLRPVTEQAHVRTFEKRLHALSRAHDVLLHDNHDSAPIQAIMATTLESLAPADRVDLRGPRTIVGPKGALSLALLLHELGTNAVKYGALSNEHGRVAIDWFIDGKGVERALHMTWQETDGPIVTPPERKGFGTKLLRMGLAGAGGVDVDYAPTGLVVKMTALLTQLQQTE